MVDECVAGPWPGETFYDITYRSVLRYLPGLDKGIAFTRGARHSLKWLETELDSHLENSIPELIYVHVLAPHPPLFLDAACNSDPSSGFSGFSGGTVTMTAEERAARIAAYIRQVECVNSTLAAVGDAVISHDAVALFIGDHGSDLGGQLLLNGDDWTVDQMRERFSVMFAGYGSGCDFSSIGTVLNAGRRLLNCIGGVALDDLATLTYVLRTEGDTTHIMRVPNP